MVDGTDEPTARRPSLARRVGVFLVDNPLTRVVVGMFLVGVAATWAQRAGRMLPTVGGVSPSTLAGAAAALAGYALFVWLYERRRPSELGVVGLAKWLPAGFALGAALLLGSAALIHAGGWSIVARTADREAWARLVATALVVQLGVAVLEEMLFRGVVFRVVERSLGSWLALGLSAVIFGLIHAGNPNATWWAALGLALQAGVLLGAAYLACRSLWLPIGIHWGWNAIQAGVVGGTVSGHTTKSVWTLEPAGPEILSGGAFGLEGSIVATTLCAALAVVFCVIAVRRGQIQPGFWARGESRREEPVAAAEV